VKNGTGNPEALHETASLIEEYIKQHLFDEYGLMYSGIDSHTGKPFKREFITPVKVPGRAQFDPWSYWTYEDSVMSMGLYLDGLILQYEVTGNNACIRTAGNIWKAIENVYSCSQVHGIGSFLRPYGGFQQMHRFMEPLGTDQASPLFCGLYRYLPYSSRESAEDIKRVMLKTLEWYEQQGFKYFYYKSFIHGGMYSTCHSNSYYLPAIAWAASLYPQDKRWNKYLKIRLHLYKTGVAQLYPRKGHPTFNWGSDLDILHRILGLDFRKTFTTDLLDEACAAVNESLENYEKPGMFKRMYPESAAPDFVPYVGKTKSIINFAYHTTVHQGKMYPGHEIYFLLSLASVGYRTRETVELISELLALRSRVPGDFTHFLSEDYEKLPETVHIYARSVGVIMVGWWRNYWLLRNILERKIRNHSMDKKV